MTPNKRQLTKWIRALRSGEYAQTTHRLQDEYGYCCLGVACEVLLPIKIRNRFGFLTGSIPIDQIDAPQWLIDLNKDFDAKTGWLLTKVNDELELTFDEIADCLEAVYVHRVLEG